MFSVDCRYFWNMHKRNLFWLTHQVALWVAGCQYKIDPRFRSRLPRWSPSWIYLTMVHSSGLTKYKALMLVVLVIISLYVLRCFQYNFQSSFKRQITSSESDEYSDFPAISRNYISHLKLHYILFHILGCFQQWRSDILNLQFCRRWLWQMVWRFLSSLERLLRPHQ